MTTPAFVQANTALQTSGTTPTVALAAAPMAGNLLVAFLITVSTATTPAGWALLQTNTYGSRNGYLYSKVSDGTETGITATIAASGYASILITEWSGAVTGTITSGGQSVTGATTTAFGPSDAPISASSIPLFLIGSGYGMGVLTPTSPFVGQQSTTVAGGAGANMGAYYYEPAPNAAATLTLTNTGTATYSVQRTTVWIDPGTAPSGDTGTSATTDGADVSASTSSQTLAGSASSTDGADNSTATGTVASPSVTGTSTTADGADNSTASGALSLSGSSATSDGADTSISASTLTLSASSVTTDGPDTNTASAALSQSAASATTDGADINAASGTVGTATITASSATTDGADIPASTSNLSMSASSATTDGADTNIGTAVLYSYATSATTDGIDVPSVFTSLLIYTTGSPRDGPDASTATGSISVSGYSATTDGQDVSTATGIVPITGYSATVDGVDVNVAYGNGNKFGILRAYLTNGQLVAAIQPKTNVLLLDTTTWAYLNGVLGTDYCYLVIGGREVVKVQGLESPNIVLVVRGLEGTQRELWPTGTAINYEITASEIQDAVNYIGYQLTVAYPLLYNAGNLSYDEMSIVGLGGADVEGDDTGGWMIQDIPDNAGCYNPLVPGQPPPIPLSYSLLRTVTEGYYRQTSDGSYRAYL